MFDFFQARKHVTTAGGQSAEAVANDPANAPVEAGPDSKTSQKTPNPPDGHEEAAVNAEAKPQTTPNTESKINRETVTALNVKVVCDLASLLPDKAKYEVTRGQAIGMALSIENGPCRTFAVNHVVGLCRRRGDVHIAKELLDQVTDNSVREQILKMCPELLHPDLVTPRHM